MRVKKVRRFGYITNSKKICRREKGKFEWQSEEECVFREKEDENDLQEG